MLALRMCERTTSVSIAATSQLDHAGTTAQPLTRPLPHSPDPSLTQPLTHPLPSTPPEANDEREGADRSVEPRGHHR